MLVERIARKLKLSLLPPPSRAEAELIDELRESIRRLPPLASQGPEQSAEAIWTRHRSDIREKILRDDPRRFLNWPVIGNTMFFSNTPYISPAFESLRRSEKWATRWHEATRESKVGFPLGFPDDPASSGNLIHHAYHLSVFEEKTGRSIEDFRCIVEFGGGYGSTCRLAHRLGFKGRYFIFDLPEFSALQRFYLKMNGLAVAGSSDEEAPAESVVCLSSLDDLAGRLKGETIDLFIADWSLSETPLELREKFLPLVSGAGNVLIGYQDSFGEVDNRKFFDEWAAGQPSVNWTKVRIEHLPENNYLIGTRARLEH